MVKNVPSKNEVKIVPTKNVPIENQNIIPNLSSDRVPLLSDEDKQKLDQINEDEKKIKEDLKKEYNRDVNIN